jgi:hypothetical protein
VGTYGVLAVKNLRTWTVIVAACGLLVAVLSGGSSPVTGSSTYATDGWGLLVAWSALGSDAERFERAPVDLDDGGTFLTTLPPKRGWTQTEANDLLAWIRRGGHVVVVDVGSSENALYSALGLDVDRVGPLAPLNPLRWRGHLHADQVLTGRSLEVRVPRFAAVPSADWTVQARTAEGKPAVFSKAAGAGSIEVILGAPLANAWIQKSENAALLDELALPVRFDEWHQGYAAPDLVASIESLRSRAQGLLAHLLFVYVLVVWALGARFGVVMPRMEWRSPKLDGELKALGALHAQSNHARAAVERLRTLARAEGIETRETVALRDAAALVSLAKTVGTAQRGRTHD